VAPSRPSYATLDTGTQLTVLLRQRQEVQGLLCPQRVAGRGRLSSKTQAPLQVGGERRLSNHCSGLMEVRVSYSPLTAWVGSGELGSSVPARSWSRYSIAVP